MTSASTGFLTRDRAPWQLVAMMRQPWPALVVRYRALERSTTKRRAGRGHVGKVVGTGGSCLSLCEYVRF
jgi:hypothetical protein